MADWWSYWAIVGDPFTGQQQIKVKKVKPPAKVQIPQGEETEEEEEETTAGRVARQGPPGSCTCAAFDHLSFLSVPSPPPPPVVKKPLKQDAAKAAKEAEVKPDKKAGPGQSRAPVVHSSNSAPECIRVAQPRCLCLCSQSGGLHGEVVRVASLLRK
jgi:hypothetical protein